MLMNPPHCHAAEEEIFVVLEGSGSVELWPHPRPVSEQDRWPGGHEKHPVRAGNTIAGPAGRGRAAGIRAGGDGVRVLAYGTREPNDITAYRARARWR